MCFIYDRVVSPCCFFFFLFAESRSLSTMRGPLWDSIRGGVGGGGGGLQVAFMARYVKYFYESYTV